MNANIDTITVNDIEYVRKDAVSEPDFTNSPIKIVILQRGWVAIGHWSQDGEMCSLDKAKTIRQWGTTKGLGELRTGPTTKTILDESGHVEFHILAVVATISCDEDKWSL